MDRGKIILLNGVSSSGKSTLARELVHVMPEYFHMSVDDFDLFIEKMEDRENGHLIPVETAYFFHRTIAMFSDKGVNVIVDHVLHDDFTREDCLRVLAEYPVLYVGVQCPMEELGRREIARGDRTLGQAQHQLAFVHKNELYDIEVDTFAESTEACAKRVLVALKSVNWPEGWRRTGENLHTDGV